MKVAADTSMLRHLAISQVFEVVAAIGYPHVELAPRDDFLPLRSRRVASRDLIVEARMASQGTDVGIASLFVVYPWASRDEEERTASVRFWREALEVAVDLDCPRVNTEFTGDLDDPEGSETALGRSLEELLPFCEREGISLAIEPHPGDFIESGAKALGFLRAIDSRALRYLHCTPHTFYLGGSGEVIRSAGDLLDHVHVADTFDPRRTILNPKDPDRRIHQHFDIGMGEIEWDEVFGALHEVRFGGVLTVCVFFWEERAEESLRHNLSVVRRYLGAGGEGAG